MKNIIYHALTVIMMFSLYSCSDNNETPEQPTQPHLNVSESKINLESDGGEKSFKIDATGDWSIVVDERASSWCSVSKKSGQGGISEVKVIVTENSDYDERNASLTIKSGNLNSKFITITQKQKDAIIVESNKVEVDERGGDITLTIKSNVDYTTAIADECTDWIHLQQNRSRALSEKNVILTIDTNFSDGSREGAITFTAGNLQEIVTIYQPKAGPTVVISKTDEVVSSDGGIVKIEIKSNTEYEFIMPDVDWMREEQSRSFSTYTRYIAVDANETYDAREAEIIVKNSATQEMETVKIIQVQKDAIVIAKSEYRVSGDPMKLTFTVNTNVEFETEIECDWIKNDNSTEARGLVEKNVSFLIDRNLETSERIGFIHLRHDQIRQTIKVTQAIRKDKMFFEITHSEKDFEAIDFSGIEMKGKATWGDGSESDAFDGHSYKSNNEKTAVFETSGIDEFKIKTLNSISSIIIYIEDDEEIEETKQ